MLGVAFTNMYVKVLLTQMENSTFTGAVSCVCAYCQTKQGHQNFFFVPNLVFSVIPFNR
jgi:hypothetical protein